MRETRFEQLLKDLDRVARSANPAKNGYDARLRALRAYGKQLERDRAKLDSIVQYVDNL